MEIKYIEREVSKTLEKSIFVVFKSSIFMGIITKNKRDLELVISSFSSCQNVQKICLYPPFGHLWYFNSRRFWVISKNSIGNLWKPFFDVIIIPSATSSLKFITLDKKKENYKNLNISRTKTIFHILKTFIWWNIKNSKKKL